MAQPTAISRYQIRDRLGHGGMGVLYLALDPAIDRLVAVKLLRVNNPEIRERFIREAQIAARLQHPHIVTVYDVGTHEGQPFIAMEYIAGETLGELIHRRAPLALIRKLELVADVCEGLAYAHKRGVVHRDVKPANLMVGRESGVVKILDFGIARTAGSNLTQVGMVMGTPNYMSPEQIAGQAVDHRSDIFAVGAVLYEVLVHRQAFTGDTPHAVLHQITSVQPAQVTAINPELDAELDAILNRAMAKAPADRYADLTAMRGDLHRVMQRLEAHQGGHTIVGGLPTPTTHHTPTPTPRGARTGPDRARIAERRAARIAGNLQTAEAALAAGSLDEALVQVELAAEIEPDDPRIVRLHERVRRAIDERDAARLLGEARSRLASGALTEAARAVAEAGQLAAGSPDVQGLGREIDRAFEQRERLREQMRRAREAVDLARDYLSAGAFDAALRAASEALGYRPDDPDALDVRAAIRDAVDRRNQATMREARAQATGGRFESAIRLLQSLRPADEAIEALLAEVEAAREEAAREQAAREQAERERVERERQLREQAEREQLERERQLREQAERERLERERLQREKAERERVERERQLREQAEREQLERERLKREQAERGRVERERQLREQAEREQLERERLKREQAERDHLEREQRLREQAERDRLERERLQREQAEREQLERERLAQEEAERERQARERAERKRLERERAEEARRRAFEAFVTSTVEALDTALMEGRWHDARGALRTLDERAPDTPALDERRARLEDGIDRERRRLAVDRLLGEARSCLGADEYDEADRAIADALDLDPEDADARALQNAVAAARAEAARREQALARLREAQHAADAAVTLAQSGDVAAARARLDDAPPLPPIDDARALISEIEARRDEAERARREAERQAALRAEAERQRERERAERLARRPPPGASPTSAVPDTERTIDDPAATPEKSATALADSEDTLETDAPPVVARPPERPRDLPATKAPRQTPAAPLEVSPRPLTSASKPDADRGWLAGRKLAVLAAAVVAVLVGGWLVLNTAFPRVDEEERARAVVQDARAQFERGDQGGAVVMLEKFQPSHPIVQQALDELRRRRAAAMPAREPAATNPRPEPVTPPIAPPAGTPQTPPEATPPVATTNQPNAQQAAATESARQAVLSLSRGDPVGAIGHVVQGLRADPRNSALQAARDQALADARRRADSAQQRSIAAGAGRQAGHTEAADQLNRADQRRVAAPAEAVRLYLDAEGAFTKAIAAQRTADEQLRVDRALETWATARLTEARRAADTERWDDAVTIVNEVRTRAPGTPGLDDLARRIESARRAKPATPTPTPVPPPPQPTSSPQPGGGGVSDVQREVSAMFGQYLVAYTTRDARRVAELHPSIPATIADSFRQVTDWEVSCANLGWTQVTAARATFTCTWHIQYNRTRGGGTPPPVTRSAVFTATRTDGRWIISDRVLK